MSAYHRLISYIYAYEGGIKGKNTGFAKLETRGTSCRIQVSVRRVFAGGSPIGVYLLAGQEEIRIGTLFVRGGNGEFRAVVNCENIEGSGCNMEECCGLTLHETDSAWRAYTTIWEDAVAHAAEVELADVTAEKVREQEAEKEEATRKLAENVSGEVNSASVGKEKLDEASELTRSGEMENQDTSTETEKKEAVNINETDFGISQPQPEKLEDSNLEIFEDTETMEAVPDISETSDHQEAEVVQETQTETPQESFQESNQETQTETPQESFQESNQEAQTETPQESFQESNQEAQTEARRKDSQESTREVQKEMPPDSPPDHQEAFQSDSQNQKQPQPDSSKEFPKEDPAESLWNRLRAAYPKVTAFECADGCEILVIKPQDIGLLPRENWVYGNNSFLLHGYYNYRYLILARLGKPGERGRYILGVPGHYGNNEKYMAAMFGFDRFVRSTRQPPRDSRFGYWYTDLNFT
ncbi:MULTISPECIES: DUF6128 domain-containing protein [Clostridium]|uniref:DUF6128 domain-containing protein n=1 Tax=Clostridium TaxID=1485 RepID=UPI000E485922|nr:MULTISPECIES: DUF6128 domain-containing protein [Clostridium]MCC2171616.1 DUF6128 domain-containing protein [Clostridium fessum]RHP39256.1 hypothetical protein DWZ45_13685 [Clostridium sp. AF32-7AC]RHQ64728.1 hypothetical protein DWY27_14085 [Clostridium sp. AF24-2LB]RHS69366.1 hypothetical protein DW931_14650 [Clostridium sp. AM43-3BH]